MSTPIETNTEELQEILQTVYNLPMAGGGSSEPDLVIYLDSPNVGNISDRLELLTFNQDDVISTYNKLLSGETVNCVLNATYWLRSGAQVKASNPQIIAYAGRLDDSSAAVGWLTTHFNLEVDYGGFFGKALVRIELIIHGNGTVSIELFTVTKYVEYASAYL